MGAAVSVCGHNTVLSWVGSVYMQDKEGNGEFEIVTKAIIVGEVKLAITVDVTSSGPKILISSEAKNQLSACGLQLNEDALTPVKMPLGGRSVYVSTLRLEHSAQRLPTGYESSILENKYDISGLKVFVLNSASDQSQVEFSVDCVIRMLPYDCSYPTKPAVVYYDCVADRSKIRNKIDELRIDDEWVDDPKYTAAIEALTAAVNDQKSCTLDIDGVAYICYNKYSKNDWVIVTVAEEESSSEDSTGDTVTPVSKPVFARYTNWAQPIGGDTVLGAFSKNPPECPDEEQFSEHGANACYVSADGSTSEAICYAVDPEVYDAASDRYIAVGAFLRAAGIYTTDENGDVVLQGVTCSPQYAAAPGFLWGSRYPAQRLASAGSITVNLAIDAPVSSGSYTADGTFSYGVGSILLPQKVFWRARTAYDWNFNIRLNYTDDSAGAAVDRSTIRDTITVETESSSEIKYNDRFDAEGNALNGINIDAYRAALNKTKSLSAIAVGDGFTFACPAATVKVESALSPEEQAALCVGHTDYKVDNYKLDTTYRKDVYNRTETLNGSETHTTKRTVFADENPVSGGTTSQSYVAVRNGLCIACQFNSEKSNHVASPDKLPAAARVSIGITQPGSFSFTGNTVSGGYWTQTRNVVKTWTGDIDEGPVVTDETLNGNTTSYVYNPVTMSASDDAIFFVNAYGVAVTSATEPEITAEIDLTTLPGGTISVEDVADGRRVELEFQMSIDKQPVNGSDYENSAFIEHLHHIEVENADGSRDTFDEDYAQQSLYLPVPGEVANVSQSGGYVRSSGGVTVAVPIVAVGGGTTCTKTYNYHYITENDTYRRTTNYVRHSDDGWGGLFAESIKTKHVYGDVHRVSYQEVEKTTKWSDITPASLRYRVEEYEATFTEVVDLKLYRTTTRTVTSTLGDPGATCYVGGTKVTTTVTKKRTVVGGNTTTDESTATTIDNERLGTEIKIPSGGTTTKLLIDFAADARSRAALSSSTEDEEFDIYWGKPITAEWISSKCRRIKEIYNLYKAEIDGIRRDKQNISRADIPPLNLPSGGKTYDSSHGRVLSNDACECYATYTWTIS